MRQISQPSPRLSGPRKVWEPFKHVWDPLWSRWEEMTATGSATGHNVSSEHSLTENSLVGTKKPPMRNPPMRNPPMRNPPMMNPPMMKPPMMNPPMMNPTIANTTRWLAPRVLLPPLLYVPTRCVPLEERWSTVRNFFQESDTWFFDIGHVVDLGFREDLKSWGREEFSIRATPVSLDRVSIDQWIYDATASRLLAIAGGLGLLLVLVIDYLLHPRRRGESNFDLLNTPLLETPHPLTTLENFTPRTTALQLDLELPHTPSTAATALLTPSTPGVTTGTIANPAIANPAIVNPAAGRTRGPDLLMLSPLMLQSLLVGAAGCIYSSMKDSVVCPVLVIGSSMLQVVWYFFMTSHLHMLTSGLTLVSVVDVVDRQMSRVLLSLIVGMSSCVANSGTSALWAAVQLMLGVVLADSGRKTLKCCHLKRASVCASHTLRFTDMERFAALLDRATCYLRSLLTSIYLWTAIHWWCHVGGRNDVVSAALILTANLITGLTLLFVEDRRTTNSYADILAINHYYHNTSQQTVKLLTAKLPPHYDRQGQANK
ncbi:putative transmembrane protein, partial [Gregarina niphandrodes]